MESDLSERNINCTVFKCKSHFSLLKEIFQCMTSPLLHGVQIQKLAMVTLVEAIKHSVPSYYA